MKQALINKTFNFKSQKNKHLWNQSICEFYLKQRHQEILKIYFQFYMFFERQKDGSIKYGMN